MLVILWGEEGRWDSIWTNMEYTNSARSAEIGASRRKKMIARDELLQTLVTEGIARCGEVIKDESKYRSLLRDLIVQGLIKLYETDVVIVCRTRDVRMIESMLHEIMDKYSAIMMKETKLDVSKSKLSVSKEERSMLPANQYVILLQTIVLSNWLIYFSFPRSAGGVTLVAKQGKIVCDNTLDT